jgi:hypothetical protein
MEGCYFILANRISWDKGVLEVTAYAKYSHYIGAAVRMLYLVFVLLNEPFSWGYTPSPVVYSRIDLVCADMPDPLASAS